MSNTSAYAERDGLMPGIDYRIHIGYESITDEDHEKSPYMRIRHTRMINKHFPNCRVHNLSATIDEALRNCASKKPDIAILSIKLPQDGPHDLVGLIRKLQKLGVKVVILYKVSEAKPEDEKILKVDGVTTIRVKKFQEDFAAFLATLTS